MNRKSVLFYALPGAVIVIFVIATVLYVVLIKESVPTQERVENTSISTAPREAEMLEASTGNFNLGELTTAEGLRFPKIVQGHIDLSNLTDAKGLQLPEMMGGEPPPE